MFEYAIDCDFKAETEDDECEGNFKIGEINESDFDIVVSKINLTKKGEIGNKARSVLKKCLKDEIIKKISTLLDEIRKIDNDTRK